LGSRRAAHSLSPLPFAGVTQPRNPTDSPHGNRSALEFEFPVLTKKAENTSDWPQVSSWPSPLRRGSQTDCVNHPRSSLRHNRTFPIRGQNRPFCGIFRPALPVVFVSAGHERILLALFLASSRAQNSVPGSRGFSSKATARSSNLAFGTLCNYSGLSPSALKLADPLHRRIAEPVRTPMPGYTTSSVRFKSDKRFARSLGDGTSAHRGLGDQDTADPRNVVARTQRCNQRPADIWPRTLRQIPRGVRAGGMPMSPR